MQILQIEGVNTGTDFVDEWMRAVEGTATESAPFAIAPCLLPKTTKGTLRLLEQYIDLARQHPSAARVNGEFVVYVFGSRGLSVQEWTEVLSELDAKKLPVYLVGDLQTNASQHGNSLNRDLVTPYVGLFDAVWLFDDTADQFWPELVRFVSEENQVFVGGVMPGYNRETARGGYLDAEGTGTFRRQWQRNLDATIPWVNVVTWNDYVESTNIRAGSDWNLTRQDINAFFSAILRRTTLPFDHAESYVTSAKFVRAGDPIRAEGLVLNGGEEPVEVSTQILDINGHPLAPAKTKKVAGAELGDATTSLDSEPKLPPGVVVYAEVTLRDAQQQLLQKVRSAPILVYAAGGPASSPDLSRRTYYSIPARKALPTPVTLSMTGTPNAGQQGVATATTPSPVRFLQVLQNTRSVGLDFDSASYAATVPMQPRVIVGGQRVLPQPQGFYVARAIDDQGRVGYSEPQFFG